MDIKFDIQDGMLDEKALQEAEGVAKKLEQGAVPGNEFLGWLNLPAKIEPELSSIQDVAADLKKTDALVVIGIGGSYLGARAVIEALRNPYESSNLPVHFAGQNLDATLTRQLLEHLSGKKYSINVISKSGTTTEPGLAFRLFRQDLESRHAGEVKNLIVATTDEKKGALKNLAGTLGLRTFIIPDDVGGRFSVFTPVGLLPVSAAGGDIKKLVAGAKDMREVILTAPAAENPALLYAAYRNLCYRQGKKVEIMSSYVSRLHYISEWWKQLYGESEGKNGQGIFPASVDFTTDLHSLGQYIQDGERILFQTVLDVEEDGNLPVPFFSADEDGFNYLKGQNLHDINRVALQATMEAHRDGGVPVSRIVMKSIDEYLVGGLLYLFEYACAISANMQGINAFDQPGVEAYKKNMFRLLGKVD